jgi:hypothetical protein
MFEERCKLPLHIRDPHKEGPIREAASPLNFSWNQIVPSRFRSDSFENGGITQRVWSKKVVRDRIHGDPDTGAQPNFGELVVS